MLPPWMVPNVLAAALAVATSYFVHVHDTSHHRHHRLLAMDVVFDAMTPCGENGRFCRERVFGDGDDADAATRPCFQARLAVEKSVFGQEESTEMVLDAICDAFREMDHAEEEDENDLANRKPLVMSLHGSPGVGKSHFHRVLARAVYGVNDEKKKEKATTLMHAVRNFIGNRKNRRRTKTCPGELCPAYKILFGAEYVEKDRAQQKRMIVSNLRAHLRRFPESVVVIEEYDKLPCEVRSVLRQLFDSGRVMQSTASTRKKKKGKSGGLSRLWRRDKEEEDVTNDIEDEGNDTFEDYDVTGEKREVLGSKAIFILEANAGFVHIHGAAEADRKRRLRKVGDDNNKNNSERERHHVELSRALKNAMFTKWEKEHCEDFHDTLKVLSSIEYFVPFQPLDEKALKQIANAQLEYRSKYLIKNEFVSSMLATLSSSKGLRGDLPQSNAIKQRLNVNLIWDDLVLAFVARESEFEGEFAIEGGKEVKSTLSRTVTRAIRGVLLPSSTTNELIRDTHSHAQYEKIRDAVLLESSKKKSAGAPKRSSGDVAAVIQVNVRLAVTGGRGEETSSETKDSTLRYQSVVASIEIVL